MRLNYNKNNKEMEDDKMQYRKFAEQVKEIINTDIDYFIINKILGLAYDKFMYKKEYKELDQIYSIEEILLALKQQKDYIEKYITNTETKEHKANMIIKAIRKDLAERIEDDFEI